MSGTHNKGRRSCVSSWRGEGRCPPWKEYITPALKRSTTGVDVMPNRFVSHGESDVSTEATLMRGIPRASREAVSETAIFSPIAFQLSRRARMACKYFLAVFL